MPFFGGGGASVDLASPPAIGNTTANTGRFTTIESTSRQFITTADGSIQIGRDGGNALGSNAIQIQPLRSSAAVVAAGSDSIGIGRSAYSFGAESVALGNGAQATGAYSSAIGTGSLAQNDSQISIGRSTGGNGKQAIQIGVNLQSPTTNCIMLGSNFDTLENVTVSNYGEFTTHAWKSYFWKGTTTNNTATELFLFGNTSGSSRAVISANTLALIDLYIVGNSTGAGKAIISRRFFGIRRDNSNNTSLVGSVQTLGADQNTGSPTWSVAITADDTNESARVEVTGATGETVNWKVLGFVRLV